MVYKRSCCWLEEGLGESGFPREGKLEETKVGQEDSLREEGPGTAWQLREAFGYCWGFSKLELGQGGSWISAKRSKYDSAELLMGRAIVNKTEKFSAFNEIWETDKKQSNKYVMY